FKHVPKHIKDNPNLGLALLSSFPARSASVVASQFLTSWFIKVMCPYDDSDLDLPEIGVRCMFYDSRSSTAVSSDSRVSGVIQGVAIGFSIVYGILNEKLPNARYGFMVAAFIGALSYSTVATIDDPRDEGLYVSAVFMGMSQISMVMASQIFLVRQLPKE